ncbi:hypothetical protein GS429_15855 [Natronorubrum sp. JWXQ-INN-674]|uniref:Erythromycin esterase n=1 Tax=Natronorubrum halalkaliphilum TaxID=2691917 RepID=A0A6B0VQQ2_9EURY|nr:erythromycin esterase family protein [Natronorubrum halalkaliphilum]MXV63503.1 hypothetical protein [Natronorubrum halalkaliphilum]
MTPQDQGSKNQELEPISQAIIEARTILTSVDPNSPQSELTPIADIVGDATVVGLGEHSHGTNEVFQYRYRLFRYLVTEHDFRVFALETEFSGAVVLDEYVTGGDGTAHDVIAHDGVHAIYQCEPMVELIEWIRSFNEGRDADDQVRVHGIDLNFSTPTRIVSFLERVDLNALDEIADPLERIAENAISIDLEANLDEIATGYSEIADQLLDRFEQNRSEYIQASSEREFELAKRDLEVVAKSGEHWSMVSEQESAVALRSEVMAENVRWAFEYESSNRVVVWAHNNHVNRGPFADGSFGDGPSMGEHLARAEELEYVNIASSVGEESFLSFSMEEGSFEAFDRPDAPAGSLADVLSEVDDGPFFVDLETLRDDERAEQWLQEDAERLVMGARVDDEDEMMGVLNTNPAEEFDGLFFIPEGTPVPTLDD